MKTVLLKTTMEKVRNYYSGVVFLPVMDDAEDVPFGECIAELIANRNPANHRRFFEFIARSFDMQEDFVDREQWRKYIQMKAGHYEAVVTPTGKTLYWPKSISWECLDETEFKKLFTEVVNAFIRYYGTGLTELQLNSILEF